MILLPNIPYYTTFTNDFPPKCSITFVFGALQVTKLFVAQVEPPHKFDVLIWQLGTSLYGRSNRGSEHQGVGATGCQLLSRPNLFG